MEKSLNVYPEKCNSCRLCELVCSFKKTNDFNPARSRIQLSVFPEEAFYIPVVCPQCAEAWCVDTCPNRAISRDTESGVVRVDEERCVGCRMCTLACPFGLITYDPVTSKAVKCDYCGGDPECVRFCPTGALAYEREPQPTRIKRGETAKRLLASYKEG